VAEHLRQNIAESVGVEVRIGTASLPQDAITFESLMEKASQNMDHRPPPWPTHQISQLALEQRPVTR